MKESPPRRVEVSGQRCAGLGDVLGVTVDPARGQEVPNLWHWVAVASWPSLASLGDDGHLRERPPGVPPGAFRVFAGGRIRFDRPLRIGEVVEVSTALSPAVEKTGRSGQLTLVTERSTITDAAGHRVLEEEKDLIYRASDAPNAAPPRPPRRYRPVAAVLARVGVGTRQWTLRTDPVALMKFSALTANTHRIHFDWPYATQQEGHADLVVHGPLSTLALVEAVRQDHPAARISAIRHRARSPLYCGDDATMRWSRSPEVHGRVTAVLADANSPGHVHVSTEIDLEPETLHADGRDL